MRTHLATHAAFTWDKLLNVESGRHLTLPKSLLSCSPSSFFLQVENRLTVEYQGQRINPFYLNLEICNRSLNNQVLVENSFLEGAVPWECHNL